jgi:hypothetical protein
MPHRAAPELKAAPLPPCRAMGWAANRRRWDAGDAPSGHRGQVPPAPSKTRWGEAAPEPTILGDWGWDGNKWSWQQKVPWQQKVRPFVEKILAFLPCLTRRRLHWRRPPCRFDGRWGGRGQSSEGGESAWGGRGGGHNRGAGRFWGLPFRRGPIAYRFLPPLSPE